MASGPAVCPRTATTADPSSVAAARDRQARLEALRRQIADIQGRHRRIAGRCRTGLPALDAALGGGLLRPAVHELIAADQASGAQTLALHLALAVARSRDDPADVGPHADGTSHRPILWLDPQQRFYPPAAAELGLGLDRLLISRCTSGSDVLWLAEQALRCPAIAVVVLPMRTIEPLCLRRLQLAAETGTGTALLVLETATGQSFAASRLVVEPLAPDTTQDEITAAWTHRLRIRIDRLHGGPAGREVEVCLPLHTALRRRPQRRDACPTRLQTA